MASRWTTQRCALVVSERRSPREAGAYHREPRGFVIWLARRLLVVLPLALAACAPPGPRLTDPKAVVNAYLSARAEHDLSAALDLVADDAVLKLIRFELEPSGKERLRDYLSLPQLSFELVRAAEADGERVTWIERVSFPADVEQDDHYARAVRSFKASVEAVVRGGRIVSLLENDVSVRCLLSC
jgi:hypothetical protein